MSTNLTRSEAERYLRLIGISQCEPSPDVLTRIVRAHLAKIPFENISKLWRWRTSGFEGLVGLTQFLDGIEQFHFGGTCYSNNFHLYQLLAYLGFDVTLRGADMSSPDVHMVNIVRIAGREYIVDVGYASPFFDPLPRDLTNDHIVSFGVATYVLSPKDSSGRSRVTFCRNGTAHHGYVVNPTPRDIEYFDDVIADSFRPDATFMNAVLIARFDSDRSLVLHNMKLTMTNGFDVKEISLPTKEELPRTIEKIFGIPSAISQVALKGISLHQDAWS